MMELEPYIFYSSKLNKYYYVIIPKWWQNGDYLAISPPIFASEEEALDAADSYLTYKDAQWN